MKVKSLGKDWFIRELDRVPSKDEEFELSDERAKALSTCDNNAKQPLVEIIEAKKEVKVETKVEVKEKPKKKGK